MRATIQLCTYNRAALLGRVLDACFEQTLPFDAYEVVLVNDGSRDETPAVIERARGRATCAFTVIDQPNAGLARARNAGIARSRGERIAFIDDDVLVSPAFLAEHLKTAQKEPDAIVRGGVINTDSFDLLPAPAWSIANYSGNFFWTTNVSVSRARLEQVGPFTETFREYGWEDIELGLRLRFAGTRSLFNPRALAYHYKPPPRARNVNGMIAQARAQARTARELYRLHPHWRVVLATGDHPAVLTAQRALRVLRPQGRLERVVGERESDRVLTPRERAAARALARDAYFDELASGRTRAD
jgi:glycosyltransferase involved in cell wall biosynthesis